MEDVRPVLMHMDAFHIFTIKIPTQVWTAVNHQTFFALFLGFVGKDRAEQACAYY